MTITYTVGNSLYVNVTNRCTNACDFCVRQTADGTYGDLWLDKEPSAEQIFESVKNSDPTKYDELVFCGYGEPTIRLEEVLSVAKKVKEQYGMPIRINTNGHASLIYGYDVTPRLSGLIDCVSVSLNAADAKSYDSICHSEFGEEAYDGLLDFAQKAAAYVPNVMLSIVSGSIPDGDIEICKKIAAKKGLTLKIREFIG